VGATLDPIRNSSRLPLVAALAWLATLQVDKAADAQERTSCLAGASGAPSVFIDSTASEVTVVTPDGARLNASRNLLLCPGDEVQTGATGRVAIRFDQKRTVIRLDGNSRTRVLSGGTGDGDVSLISGILYFVSSVRRHFEVDTPYIVAGIDGTEAIVAVRPPDRLAMAVVREGLVSAYDRRAPQVGVLKVAGGEAAFRSQTVPFQSAPIGALPAPFRDLLIASDAAVDWAVYYPPIILVRDATSPAVRRAITLLASGEYDRAAAALDAGKAPAGQTAALRAIIAISRNLIPEAERWAEAALQADPQSASAPIAMSYVRQATGDLDGALKFAEQAAELAPQDAYAVARLAEMQMVVGDRRAAVATANKALAIERIPLALFVAGLAELAAARYEKAEALFNEAITLDSEAPLPRLGLGLAYIRRGHTAEGTWELERAVILDPRRASLRTWLGRAYFDEELTAKAAEELRLAKLEDPDDPTPYLFSALQLYSQNRPIPALRELQEAEERGGLRRTLRSARGLAEDSATRGAAEGRIYDVLGFDQLAINSGARAADADPSNAGAHRFLSDAYRQRPGYEMAQTSELLRSQLLSPPSKTPVQPQLAESALSLLDTTGPSRVTFAEFAPLFDADGVRLDASGLMGTQKTLGDEIAFTALYRTASFSVGQFHYETDGFRQNNDIKHDIFDAVGTVALTPEFSVFGEYRLRDSEAGDRTIDFNINDFEPTGRSDLRRELARAGFHLQPTAESDMIGVYTWSTLNSVDRASDIFTGDIVNDSLDEAHSVQLQHVGRFGALRTAFGGMYMHTEADGKFTFFGSTDETKSHRDFLNGYGYFYLDYPQRVTWTLGGGITDYAESNNGANFTKFSPKLGVLAALNDHLAVRAAYLRNVKPDFVMDQVIEPTSVAGFNQFYDGYNGSTIDQYGAGIDLKFGRLMFGGEGIRRHWDIPAGSDSTDEILERIGRLYAYVTLTDEIALSAEFVDEHSEADARVDFSDWHTLSVPLRLSYFNPLGPFGLIGVDFVDHSYELLAANGSDTFHVVNGTLGYRFPNGRGIISLEALNILDENFHFQNRDLLPEAAPSPRYAPERTLYARASIRF